jgi:hypothetical protein
MKNKKCSDKEREKQFRKVLAKINKKYVGTLKALAK